MAREHPQAVQRGLQLKKAGNEVMRLIGGREIHPINVRVGGFYRVPSRPELEPLRERLLWARDAALETVRWVARLEFPDHERDYELVALRHPEHYPIDRGRIVSSRGLDLAPADYDAHFEEHQVPHSSALHARIRGRGPYLVGPLARYGLNADRLSPLAKAAAQDAGLGPVCRNPYRSIIVRSVEVLYACDEALRLIDGYEEPERPAVPVDARAGIGHGCTEAPRGILYHRYRLDDDGTILDARIVPPTSQNQPTIEHDLRSFIGDWLELDNAALRWRCEQTVRNYDPCISCATHFLRVEVEHGP
jgi:sulfhydrogenase subunit alpha